MPRLEDDDAELARRIAASAPGRDGAAEAELCRRFAPRIRFYGLRHLRNEAAVLPDVAWLRQLAFATQRVQLLAVERATERVIADYTFNHSPYAR